MQAIDQHDQLKEAMAILHATQECSVVGWRFRVVVRSGCEVGTGSIPMRSDEGCREERVVESIANRVIVE